VFSVGIRTGSYSFVRDGILSATGGQKQPWLMALSGAAPGSFGYLISTPFWQIKAISQAETGLLDAKGAFSTGNRVGQLPQYTGLVSTFGRIRQTEGMRGLYRGALPLTLRGGMLSAGQFLGYDGTKTFLKKQGYSDSPLLHVTASIVAAFLATTFSAPFDLVLTRYQTGPTMGKHYSGPVACARELVREEGITVLYRGWSVFFGRVAPVFTLMMPLFEQVRYAFGLGYMD
jgi:hypothetical protein